MHDRDITAMDDRQLRCLFHSELAADKPGRWCPDEMRLAAYFEHRLSLEEEARIETHLADCGACLAQLEFLVRHPCAAGKPVAAQVLSRARDLVADRAKGWRAPVLRWGAVAAAAACFMLVVSYELREPGVMPGPQAPKPAATSPASSRSAPPAPAIIAPVEMVPEPPPRSAVRNSVNKPLQLDILFPAENATLPPQQLEFRWNGTPAAAYYEISLVTEDGSVVWQGKVAGRQARCPDSVSLEAGKKYFVWVRAHLSTGGTVKSTAVSFHVGDT
jgi:hypothetical protein